MAPGAMVYLGGDVTEDQEIERFEIILGKGVRNLMADSFCERYGSDVEIE